MPAVPAIMIAATVASAAAAGASAVAQKRAADYNAEVATNAAKAKDAQTNESIRRMRLQNEQILGAQRVAAATSGGTMSGSTLTSLGANAGILESHIADAYNQGQAERTAYLNRATLSRQQGNADMTTGMLQAGGTLLGGGADAYGYGVKYLGWKT